jgi:MoxR-like ATPase
LPDQLRHEAEDLAAGFPDLLAQADQLAATISLGAHGRRRAGQGDEFWQYRPAMAGDAMRSIDWRRSARSEGYFVRQMEWQNLQSVHLWIDRSASMTYRGSDKLPDKGTRARVLGLACAILLSKAGESVGLMEDPQPPKHGRGQVTKMAMRLADAAAQEDYGVPPSKQMTRGNRAVFISDFLGDWEGLVSAMARAADQRVQGALVQVLDPSEEAFAFDGRTIFESMRGAISFETRRARALRDEYLERLAARKDALEGLARRTGWLYTCHHTDQPAQGALLWIHNAVSGVGQ